MTDFKIDPNLKAALLNGHISRIAIDLESKKITVWYRDRNLSDELDRHVDKHLEGHTLRKSDYAFDIQLLLSLQGLFVIDNAPSENNHKAVFRFDIYKNVEIKDLP